MLEFTTGRRANTSQDFPHSGRLRVALTSGPKEQRPGHSPGIHPGEVLLDEFLSPLGITPYKLAKSIGVQQSRIDALLEGKRPVSADIAIRLARYLDVTPQFWLNLQVAFDVYEQLRKQPGAYDDIRAYNADTPTVGLSESRETDTGEALEVASFGAEINTLRKINAKDGAEMIFIPAGEFLMGSTETQVDALMHAYPGLPREWFASCLPQRWVHIDAYWMYRTPVTVAQYRKFCASTGRTTPRAPEFNANWCRDNHPMVNVTWDDAAAYAKWAGARLPTEAEWEKAARGTDGRQYPWGDEWDPARCASAVGKKPTGTKPVGLYPTGASPYGILDMAGNVWEWCADWYDETYYKWAPPTNPQGPPARSFRVLRGGSWFNISPYMFRAAARDWVIPETRLISNGVRPVATA